MLRRLYDWTMSLAATRHAEKALFGVSFVESSIFPIPPDALLIPMVLARRESWIRLALICTVGSVLGAFMGYAIGMFLFETIGQPILAFYGKADSFQELSAWYNSSSWGGWAIFGAAITPFPYKVVTIFSGTTGFNLLAFTVISVIGRGFRFFLVAFLLYRFGDPIRVFIEKYLNLLFILFVLLLVGGLYAVKFVF
ncbi:DedA family protein [Pseudohoeflea suaedae]|uniref:DedA family protein n=1 Tax=Pseudohoeflea suaedae TaxID=877384 RepID=A0A4V3A6V8_9HYPH|nr:YqaA family protein [Pseudohoeflea suaedae]TDH34848.1 DedA family protein [Pseudohoeflea suaedae]